MIFGNLYMLCAQVIMKMQMYLNGIIKAEKMEYKILMKRDDAF